MSRNALALSDQQLAAIQAAAKLLPVEIRGWFLNRVADALSNKPHPHDIEVERAVTSVLSSARVPVPLDLFDQCGRQP